MGQLVAACPDEAPSSVDARMHATIETIADVLTDNSGLTPPGTSRRPRPPVLDAIGFVPFWVDETHGRPTFRRGFRRQRDTVRHDSPAQSVRGGRGLVTSWTRGSPRRVAAIAATENAAALRDEGIAVALGRAAFTAPRPNHRGRTPDRRPPVRRRHRLPAVDTADPGAYRT